MKKQTEEEKFLQDLGQVEVTARRDEIRAEAAVEGRTVSQMQAHLQACKEKGLGVLIVGGVILLQAMPAIAGSLAGPVQAQTLPAVATTVDCPEEEDVLTFDPECFDYTPAPGGPDLPDLDRPLPKGDRGSFPEPRCPGSGCPDNAQPKEGDLGSVQITLRGSGRLGEDEPPKGSVSLLVDLPA